MSEITYDDFWKVEVRTGKVIRAEPFPEAHKPAYKLWIDLGEIGVKQSSAQITRLYTPEELIGMRVLAVTNLSPIRVAGFKSEVLVLGVEMDDGEVALVQADREVPLGSRISTLR